jgi:hypothetical protein
LLADGQAKSQIIFSRTSRVRPNYLGIPSSAQM